MSPATASASLCAALASMLTSPSSSASKDDALCRSNLTAGALVV